MKPTHQHTVRISNESPIEEEKIEITPPLKKVSPHLSKEFKKKSISVEELFESTEGVGDDEFLQLIGFTKIKIFNRNDLFTVVSVVNSKLIVWSLEKSKRMIFKRLIEVIDKSHKPRTFLLQFLFRDNIIPPPQTRNFLHLLFTYREEIFNEESLGVVYSPDGLILSCIKDIHWDSYFELPLLTPEQFILQCFVYLTNQQFFENLHQVTQKLLNAKSKKDPSLPHFIDRLSQLLLSWLTIFKELIPSVYNELMRSCLFASDLFDEMFIENYTNEIEKLKPVIKSKIGVEIKQQFALPKKVSVEDLIQIETKNQEKKVVNRVVFYEIKYKIFASQLVIYDSDSCKNVYFSEFYTTKQFKTLQNYINKVKKIESLATFTLKKQPNKQLFTFFTKVADECVIYGDYNISYMIFSSLNQILTTKPQLLNELKKSVKNKYNNLNQLFSISGNHKAYYEHFEQHPLPKIPIAALWMGEIIRYSDLPSVNDDGSLNMIKVRKISKIMNSLLAARETPIPFPRNNEIQTYLSELSFN